MNFYTLTFKPKRWIKKALVFLFIAIVFIFSFNYIVDPYNITKYNLLKIEHKFARDDRVEKVNYFKTLPRFDNILIGSSRVYTINPQTVSKILGGTTYNFGVGTATVEDHLGTLLYLQRLNKLPKRLIVGVDFYTFNKDIAPNSYFLANEELNFLSYSQDLDSNYWAKFLSFDAFRASFKTFKNHIKKSNEVPRFDKNGWNQNYIDSSKRDLEAEIVVIQAEIDKNRNLYSNYEYKKIDSKRIKYYEKIKGIAKANNIELYIFVTPLHPILVKILKQNPTQYALNQLERYFSSYDNFINFIGHDKFSKNLYNFHGATHTTSDGGDEMMKILLKKDKDANNRFSNIK